MADIQTAMPTVDEVFTRISAEPDVRFVISMGDITDRARDDEYELFERQLAFLDVPYYTTLGNHELWADPARYRDRYGRASFQFVFKDVAFTFADSGNAGLDPLVYDWLDDWLDRGRDRVHLFLTHFPLIDPIGVREGSFRSRREAHLLLSRLASAKVDLTLYGHIHSYYAYDNAGIPAFISGGGGADPERWDGIHRHFLVIDLDPEANRVGSVGVVRVD
jgi:3',5'-cyclic-AMP phosphodiesterase